MATDVIFYSEANGDNKSWITSDSSIGNYLQFGSRAVGVWYQHMLVRVLNRIETIPKGAVINSAHLNFKCSSDSRGTVHAKVHMVDAADPAAPTTSAAADALSLTPGTAWDPVPLWTAWSRNDSIDFKDEVQAFINNRAWNLNEAGIVVVRDDSSSYPGIRDLRAYIQNPADMPEVHINYDPPAVSYKPQPIMIF